MKFESFDKLNDYLSILEMVGIGSSSVCYLRKCDNSILKIFHEFENHQHDDILRFTNIETDNFVWPSKLITVGNIIVGYTMPYVNAKNLYMINPFNINLNTLEKAIIQARNSIHTISEKGIATYDMLYNILYRNRFYIIDQDEYYFSDMDTSKIERQNNINFDYEIYLFLVDGIFKDIVNDSKILKEQYLNNENILQFIKLFRQRLSELVGNNITYLREASNYKDKDGKQFIYQRK